MNYCQFRNDFIKRMANGGGLPSIYQAVAYLQSNVTNGWQSAKHIDTGLTYFADFEIVCTRTNNDGTKFCGVQRNTCLQRSGSDGKFAFYNTSSNYYNSSYSILAKTKIAWRSGKIYIDDVYIRDYTKATSTTGGFHLFGVGGSEYSYYNNIRIYSFKAWDTSGVLIRDMIPCYIITDNTPGFYDLANHTFYPPQGSVGSLIAGPDITN